MVLWMGWMLPTQAQQSEFLSPEKAFAFHAELIDSSTVRVSFDIAPSYYMYRDEFAFALVSPDQSVMLNGSAKLPAGQVKFDENFNKNLTVYHSHVVVNVPIKRVKAGESMFKLVVSSRGCADKGLCYPPRKNQAVLTLADQSASVHSAEQAATSPSVAVNTSAATISVDEAVSARGGKVVADTKPSETMPVEVKPAATVVSPAMVETNSGLNKTMGETQAKGTPQSSSMIDNSFYARTVLSQYNPVWALVLVFGLGVLLSLTPCVLPMVPILSVVLAGQKDTSRGRGFLLALAYVTGMAAVYATIGVLAAKTGSGLHQYLQSPWVLGGFALLLVLMALSMFDVFHLQLPTSWQYFVGRYTQGKRGYSGAMLMGAASALIASPCVTAPLIGLIGFISQTGQVGLGGLALFVLAYGMGLPLLVLGAGFGQWLPKSGAWMVRIKQVIGVLMVVAALWIAQPLWGKYLLPSQHDAVFQPVGNLTAVQSVVESSDKPVLLDFYADWCRSCIEMEHKTFNDPQVVDRLKSFNLIRVDMTQFTTDHEALLKQYQLYGPPALLVLEAKTGKVKMQVVGFEDPLTFKQHLDASLP